MSGCNLAIRSPAERLAVDADRAACLIRWEIRNLSETDRKRVGRLLLEKTPAHMRQLIAEKIKSRARQ